MGILLSFVLNSNFGYPNSLSKMKKVIVTTVDYSILVPMAGDGDSASVLFHLSSKEARGGRKGDGDNLELPLKVETANSSLKTLMKTLNSIQVEIDRLLNIQ